MIKKTLAALLGGGVLSAFSLSKNQQDCVDIDPQLPACENIEREGFPFSFINDHADTIDAGKGFVQDQFELAPALANLVFWAVVAAVVLKFLSWAFEKFSLLIFVGIILLLGASYLGLLQAV